MVKTDSSKDSQDSASSPKRVTIKKEKEVDNNESSSSTGLSDETLCDHRFTIYGNYSTAVHKVRAKILGLKAGMRPSQQSIDSSPIFALRRAVTVTLHHRPTLGAIPRAERPSHGL